MAESKFQQPTTQQLEDFVKGDPVVINEVMYLLLPQLHRWALQKYPTLLREDVKSVVNHVLAEAARNSVRYDPMKAQITTYLIGMIEWRMATLYQATQKQTKFEETSLEKQENLTSQVYNLSSTAKIVSQFERRRFFERVGDKLNKCEQEVLTLMLQGEKSQHEFQRVIERYQPVIDPESDVKNYKERLKRKVRAIAEELGYTTHDLLDE